MHKWHPSRASSLRPWGNGLWQWYNWRWPLYRHQFTTRTIWRLGHAPFRNRAWQPDVSGWTLGRFAFDNLHWARQRNTSPSRYAVDLNTGTAVQVQTPEVV